MEVVSGIGATPAETGDLRGQCPEASTGRGSKFSQEVSGFDSCAFVCIRAISGGNTLCCPPPGPQPVAAFPPGTHFQDFIWSDLVGLTRTPHGLPRRSLTKAGRAELPPRPDQIPPIGTPI